MLYLDMHTLRRNLTKSIKYLLNHFPSVVLLGARQVGKSTLLKQVLPDAHFFDLEKDSDFDRIRFDPYLIFKEIPGPIIFDEAQRLPELFNALRVEIDRKRVLNGRFLISGSSSPELLSNISESLAGRAVIVEMGGFSWNESFEKRKSSFFKCLSSNLDDLKNLHPVNTHKEILETCLFGSYPEPFLKRKIPIFYDQWMSSYIKNYIERDIRSLFPALNLDAFKRFFKMAAFSNGEILNFSNFSRSLDVSQPTIKKYFEILEGTFVWRKIVPYSSSPKKRIIKMPKGHFRDSGLINYLLKINTIGDLKSHPQFGRIWESFVIEHILKGLNDSLITFDAYYYRTSNHSEVDLIIEGRFGVIPIEIKAGSSTQAKQLKVLENFIEEHRECSFGILINNGDEIFKKTEKIIQIPATYL